MKTEKKWRITATAEKVDGEDEREKTMSRKGKRFIFFRCCSSSHLKQTNEMKGGK